MRGNAHCSEVVTTLLRIILYVRISISFVTLRVYSTAGLFSMKFKLVYYMRV